MEEFVNISIYANFTAIAIIIISAAFCLYRVVQALLLNKSFVSKELSLCRSEKVKKEQGIYFEAVEGYDVSVICECTKDTSKGFVEEILRIRDLLKEFKFEILCMISPSVPKETVSHICSHLHFPDCRIYLRDIKHLQGFIQGSIRARGKYIINHKYLDQEICYVKDENLTLSLLKTNADRLFIKAIPKKDVNTLIASLHFIGFFSFTEIPILVKKFNISHRIEKLDNDDGIVVLTIASLLCKVTNYFYDHRFFTTTII